ncbi:MAG: hypothetical protein DRI95_11745 [Bacteroidetes bacterium]|nr:MAG: hypothetical protein DRI95_11745 [Bacteroidota bacterium]
MKTVDYIIFTINKLPKGYVFTYDDFITDVNKKEAVIKNLNRMATSGKIVKLSKGKFYKPEETPFGTLQPNQKQIVKDLIEKDGKLMGYITGFGIYNQLGFTTQLSNTIQIGKNETRPALKRGMYSVSFIKQKNTIVKENIPLLQLLDVIRFIRKIPDATLNDSCKRLQILLADLSEQKQKTMIRLSRKYPPATRALLGALLERLQTTVSLLDLKRSLNPITVYKLSINESILPTAPNWNIQ